MQTMTVAAHHRKLKNDNLYAVEEHALRCGIT